MGVRRITGRSHSPPMLVTLAVALLALAVLLVPSLAFADDVPVNPSDYTGSTSFRTTPGGTTPDGVTATGNWDGTGDLGFKIDWDISYSAGLYHYSYTLTNGAGGDLGKDASGGQVDQGGGISHLILEVSPDFSLGNDLLNKSASVSSDSPKTWSEAQGNPGMGSATVYGIKWEVSGGPRQATFSFDSPRQPVWGDFYAKDGGGTGVNAIYALNTGFGTDPTAATTDFTNWIPRPDSAKKPPEEVPEPTTVALLVPMVAPLGLLARRRTRA